MPIQWYFKKDGQEHGPVTSDDIRMLASLGMLQSTDLVRKAEMNRWAPASALKGLFPAPSLRSETDIVTALMPPPTPRAQPLEAPPPKPGSSSKSIWYLTGAAALFALAGGLYRFGFPSADSTAVARHIDTAAVIAPTTEPILASDMTDPLLLAISSESPFDRGMAFKQVRATTVPARLKPQVHQIICDTLDNRAFSSIWASAAQALGEVGTTADLPRLKTLIDNAPVETQCAAIASAMVLDPDSGIKYFEPHVAVDQYASTTTSYLANWGTRCEPAAVAMLKSPQRMCRYHALFLLKAFGTSKALDAITQAKKSEPDKSIAASYQFTIDAINSRNNAAGNAE